MLNSYLSLSYNPQVVIDNSSKLLLSLLKLCAREVLFVKRKVDIMAVH